MKELSIEEKAKRYDIALDKIKMLLGTGSSCSREELEYVFPELAESREDKRIIQYFKDLAPFDKAEELYEKYGFSHKDAIAWLEKQREHANFLNKIQIGDKVTRNEDGVLVNLSQLKRVANKDEKQGEQKPAEWSEEDKMMLQYAIEHFERQKRNCIEGGGRKKAMQEFIDWLKSLKDRVQPQPKQEWSEEDESKIKGIINTLEGLYDNAASDTTKDLYRAKIDWLKSLRPQSTWKPSDEQINTLWDAIVYVESFNSNFKGSGSVLEKLHNDLKKLKRRINL